MKYILKALLIINILMVQNAFGQTPDLPDEQVEVIKSFDARLADAEMADFKPQLPPVDTSTSPQTYSIPLRTIQVDYLPPKIRPLAMRRQKEDPIYNGYAKLGAGTPQSYYGKFGYAVFANKKFDFAIEAQHHSANYKKVENQRFSNNYGKMQGTYYFDEGFAVNGNIGYTRDYAYYYGYNFDERFSDTTFRAEDVRQRFSTFDIGAKIFNGEQTVSDLNYNAEADFYFMEDNYAARENGFDLKLGLTKWFNDKHPLNIKLQTDFTQFRDSTEQNLNNFFLQPNFTYHHDYFKIKIGTNIVSHEDEYNIFPDVEATVPLIGSRLNVIVGAYGSLQKNTLRTLANYNPFIGTRANLIPENTSYFDYYGGVKGSYRGFEYQGRVGYRQTENLALYVPNYLGYNRTIVPYDFRVIYDNVDIFYITGSINAPIVEGLSLIGNVSSNVYTPQKETAAWHLPVLSLQGTLKYMTLEDQVTVKVSAYVENGVPYPTEAGVKENLNGLLDISVGAEYRFLEKFGLFLDIYNLANNKRQRWYNYPTYGINVLVGVTARF